MSTSTSELAARAVATFETWIAERQRASDWQEYIRAGKVNRSEVAKECGFPRSSWGSNPGLAAALARVEAELAHRGLLSGASADRENLSKEALAEIGASEERTRRAMASKASLEKRVKALEEQNAALRAANRDLTERIRRSTFAEQHLAETGRLLPQ